MSGTSRHPGTDGNGAGHAAQAHDYAEPEPLHHQCQSQIRHYVGITTRSA